MLRLLRPLTLWAQPAPATADNQRAVDAAVTGDVLAIAVLIVTGLGLIRSFVAPWLLGRNLG